MIRLLSTSLLLLGLGLAGPATAQTVFTVSPQVFSPGDLVLINGMDLGGTTAVRFNAVVGGLMSVKSIEVVPLEVSPFQVTALVPTFGTFLPPQAMSPGDPFGTLQTVTGTSPSNTLDAYYTEGSFGQVATVGNGTTQSFGGKRSVISFDLKGGAPTPGNANFVLRLELAHPATIAFLLLGPPGTPPYPLIGDGTFTLTPTPFIFPQVFFTSDSDGHAEAPLPLPLNLAGVFGLQWAHIDLNTNQFVVSNGMVLSL